MSNIAFEPYTANIDDNVNTLIAIFKDILDCHAPLRPMSKKEQRLSNKPWITPGILNSIKTKNKLFQNHFKSNNPDKKKVYKKYLNKLTHIKFRAKRIYNKNLIKSNSNNSTQTWSIIKKIINCKQFSKKSKLPSELSVDNKMINTNSQIFLVKLCDYFANIGATMSKIIPNKKI